MITIPDYIAAGLGLKSCELPEDELEGRMLLAGMTKGSDVFHSPLLMGLVIDAPRVFTDFVLPLLDTVDMMMLSRVNKKMCDVVVTRSGKRATKEDILGVPTFVRSVALLRWARENGCPWDERTCAAAAAAGNLEVLKWAREHGCPWDERTCAAAAAGQYLEVLQWALENSCPLGKNRLLLWANHLQQDMHFWVCHRNDADDPFGVGQLSGFCGKVKNFEPTAATAGQDYMEIFQWAFENGFTWEDLRKDSDLYDLGISEDKFLQVINKLLVAEDKLKVFELRLPDLMYHRDSIPMDELSSAAASWLEDGSFTRIDVENIVSHMQKINKVLVAEGEVYLI